MPVILHFSPEIAGVNQGERMGKKIRQPWGALKEQFVRRRLAGENLSLAAFAAEKGVDPRTVERHASAENWLKAVEERALEQQRAVDSHSSRVVERLRHAVNFDEVEVRREHAALMQLLTDVALKKMETLSPDDLSIGDVTAILKFAPSAMREALGMPDLPTIRIKSGQAAAQAHFQNLVRERRSESAALEAFEQHIQKRKQVATVLAELVSIVDGERGG